MSLTRSEALALTTLSALFILGMLVRHVQQGAVPVPVGAYDELDRLFFALADSSFGPADRVGGGDDGRAAASEETLAVARPLARAAAGRVDVNRANAAALETLPRIGPKTAARIIAFRDAYGPFHRVEDLRQVRGIGPKTLELLRPFVAVGSDSTAANRR